MTDKAAEEKRLQRTGNGNRSSSGDKGGGKHTFTKEQLLSSGRFLDRRDIAEALLDDEKVYTMEAVEGKIEDYMKGKVR